jgi:hypothetical protein
MIEVFNKFKYDNFIEKVLEYFDGLKDKFYQEYNE